MADLEISTSQFTTNNMVLESGDSLTAEWGSHVACNTGWLAQRPVCLWSYSIPINGYPELNTSSAMSGYSSKGSYAVPVTGYIFMPEGTWTIYHSSTGTWGPKYYSTYAGLAHSLPDIYFAGSKVVSNLGTWVSRVGSFTYYSDGNPIEVRLDADYAGDWDNTDRYCGYISIYGVRESGEVTP